MLAGSHLHSLIKIWKKNMPEQSHSVSHAACKIKKRKYHACLNIRIQYQVLFISVTRYLRKTYLHHQVNQNAGQNKMGSLTSQYWISFAIAHRQKPGQNPKQPSPPITTTSHFTINLQSNFSFSNWTVPYSPFNRGALNYWQYLARQKIFL